MEESKVKKIERAANIVQCLYNEYPDSKCSLNYKSAHQLLVATILSAQCTDHRVNIVTKDLFLKYKNHQILPIVRLLNWQRISTRVDITIRNQRVYREQV